METTTFVLSVLLIVVTGLAVVFFRAMIEWHDLAAETVELNDKILAHNRELLDWVKNNDQEERDR